MIEMTNLRGMTRLRRLALAAQGLLQAQPYGRGLAGARNAINHIGYVQLDTISVVQRAHHHVLYSRVPNFTPSMTNRMLRDGDIFEYWAHAAAFLPISDFRYTLPYKHAIKSGETHWYRHIDRRLMDELLARIRSDGPVRSRDVGGDTKKRALWWDWKPAKKALEQLYMQGDLMVSDREGFQKTYDLTERVLPAHVDATMPSIDAFAEHLLDRQLRCHGLVSLKGITYLRRNPDLRKAVKALVKERVSQKTLQEIRLTNGEVFVLEAGALESALPPLKNRLRILSPFDNSVIQRDRLKSVFDYDYQIECYVPAYRRQYGYFCLPLLYRDRLIGRMDCKAHRTKRHLEITSLYLEEHCIVDDRLLAAFSDAVVRFCHFQDCDCVSITSVYPEKMGQPFRRALKLLRG